MKTYQMYINGAFVDATQKQTREIVNPATEDVIAIVPESTDEDARLAVEAARQAFDEGVWSTTTAQTRQRMLIELAERIRKNADELAMLEVENNGKPLREAKWDIDDAANCFEFYAGMATKIHGQTMQVPANSFSYVLREPIGVCVQIIPWNYPFLMAAWKLAAPLAAGNTIVLKPSEFTPLSALYLARLIDEVGFPKGVVNIITGDYRTGMALINNPKIDKIAFTGGTSTGKIIAAEAAKNLKKATLELGGKNPVIVFDDANLDLAIDWGVFAAFANSGQVCTAGSRLFVQENIYEKFVKGFLDTVKKIKIGGGAEPGVTLGPVVSASHLKKIKSYIEIGKSEATLAYPTEATDFKKGFFITPHVFTDVHPNCRIAKEEIFGPVVTITKFTTQAEVIKMANDSEYGLGFSVFSQDITTAHTTISKIKAGIGWVNCHHPTFNEMPWGGYKNSGIGRELGLYGIENYLEIKQVNINLDTQPIGWY